MPLVAVDSDSAHSSRVAEVAEPVQFDSRRSFVLPIVCTRLPIITITGMMTVVLPGQILEHGGSYAVMGAMVAAQGAGNTLASFPAGKWSSEYSPKAVVLGMAMVSILGSALCAAAPQGVLGSWLLALGAFLIGAADGSNTVALQTYITATAKEKLRGSVMSMLGSSNRLGQCLGPMLAGMVLLHHGATTAYAVQGVVAIAASLSCMQFILDVRADQVVGKSHSKDDKTASSGEGPVSVFDLIRQHARTLAVVGLFTFLQDFCRRGRALTIPMWGHAMKVPEDSIGGLLSLSFMVDAALMPVAGWLLDNIGRNRTGALSQALFAIAFPLMLFKSRASLLLFAVMSGVANGVSCGLVMTMTSDLAPANARGHWTGLFRGITRSADLVCPLMVGFLAQQASLSALQIAMCGVAVFACFWVSCVMRRVGPAIPLSKLAPWASGVASPLLSE